MWHLYLPPTVGVSHRHLRRAITPSLSGFIVPSTALRDLTLTKCWLKERWEQVTHTKNFYISRMVRAVLSPCVLQTWLWILLSVSLLTVSILQNPSHSLSDLLSKMGECLPLEDWVRTCNTLRLSALRKYQPLSLVVNLWLGPSLFTQQKDELVNQTAKYSKLRTSVSLLF